MIRGMIHEVADALMQQGDSALEPVIDCLVGLDKMAYGTDFCEFSYDDFATRELKDCVGFSSPQVASKYREFATRGVPKPYMRLSRL